MRTTALITRLQIAANGGALSSILDSLADGACAEAKRRAEEEERQTAMEPDVGAWFKDVLDDEWAIFERTLFGAAFVTCQAHINDVAARAQTVREHLDAHGKPIGSLPNERHELLQLLGERSEIRLIDALANYFKHSEQWALDEWKNPTRLSRHTIGSLKRWGFKEGYPDLLRDGARKFYITGGQCVSDLGRIFTDWSNNVVEAARLDAELPPRYDRTPPLA